jgi:hypothetical protein
MSRVYITHGSEKKDDSLRGTSQRFTPDRLYTATPIRRFTRKCIDEGVEWAIFSYKFGVVFSQEKIDWYQKEPDQVDDEEYEWVLGNFIYRLLGYDQVWFYHNPRNLHPLYKRFVKEARGRGLRVRMFSHLSEIKATKKAQKEEE